MTSVLIGRVGDTQGEEPHVMTEAEAGGMLCKPRNAKDRQPPPEARNVSTQSLGGTRLCQHLDRRLPASGTVGEFISVVSGYPVCGTLL